MRLKKSSSGTVGPRAGGGGGAQRWSSKREPCKVGGGNSASVWHQVRSVISCMCRKRRQLAVLLTHCIWIVSGTWHLTSILKKSSSGSALSALAIRWLSTAWLLFWLSLRPGRLPPAADDSSIRRPWAPETLAESDTAAESTNDVTINSREVGLHRRWVCGSGGTFERGCVDLHFLMALGCVSGPLFNDNRLPLSWTEQRWSSIRLLWKRLSRSKKPSSPSMSGLSR